MVFVKIRETYDLHTIRNAMSIIGIHTPKSDIIKRNYPGLLMQCKAWRPVSCDVRLACASMMPLDVQSVGIAEGDVAPEDVFNPILYKAVSNWSMSQIESFLHVDTPDKTMPSATLDFHGVSSDDFGVYYGLLSQTNEWKHANPQAGLSMTGLVPLVYNELHTIGTNNPYGLKGDDTIAAISGSTFRGKPERMPWLETTVFSPSEVSTIPEKQKPGFDSSVDLQVLNAQTGSVAPTVFCGIVIVPPSRLHQLFYRMVVEWTLEFSQIRPLGQITSLGGLSHLAAMTHYMTYDFSNSKLTDNSVDLVSTSEGMDIKKVM